MFLVNSILFLAVLLPGILLYRRYWMYPVLLGMLVLAKFGYVYFYVPITLFVIFAVTVFLRNYMAEEYGLLMGIILSFFLNIMIVGGNPEVAPSPPSNILEIPGYISNLVQKAVMFSYLPYPINYVMAIFFISLTTFAIIRLVLKVVRGV